MDRLILRRWRDKPNSSDHGLRRSLTKAISWRIIGSIDTFLLSIFVISLTPVLANEGSSLNQQDIVQAATYIALVEVVTKLFLFTSHEQAWRKISWGIADTSQRINELKRRSAVKSVLWRIIAFVDTTLIAYFFTGNTGAALTIGGLEIITKIVLYFIHERMWLRIAAS